MALVSNYTPVIPQTSHPERSVVRAFPRERFSDAELVAAVARGDRDALTAVWNRYAGAVRSALFAGLGPDHSLDDLVQEVFISFYGGAGRLERPSALKAYLLGSAVRIAAFERRTRGRRSRWMALFGIYFGESRLQQPEVEGRDAVRALDRVLGSLSERARMAFILRYVEDLSPAEIATALGTSEATAKRAISKGREKVVLFAHREPALRDYVEGLVSESLGGISP